MTEKEKKIEQGVDLDEFQRQFAAHLATIPIKTSEPIVIHKTPGVMNPGVGDLVVSAETWAKRWQKSADDSAEEWFDRAQTPSANPIDRAIAANEKRKDRLAASEKAEKWLNKMKKLKAENVFEGIQGVGAEGYKAGIAAKAAKTKRAIEVLQPKVKALKEAIQKMPDKTDGEREKKMLAARRGMLAIGGTPVSTVT